jgi:DNA-binding MarR family transcriptional regulator
MYASVLAKQVDCTYSHTVRVIQELKKLKLVNFEEKGRIKLISLTKRGKEIAETFERLVKLFERE